MPARERQQEQQAGREREEQAEPRYAVAVGPLEDRREIPVAGQAVTHPRGRRLVHQPGAEGGDEGVEPQQHSQPAQPDDARQAGERPNGDGAGGRDGRPAPRTADQVVRDRADERQLQQEVDGDTDAGGGEDGQRQVPLRVLDLTRELVGLLEAEVGEHDARRGDGGEQGLDPVRHEAAARAQVVGLELERQDDDGEHRDGDLPPRDARVDLGEQAHGQEVDRREDRQQDDGHGEAEPGDVARGRVVQAVPVVRAVLHDRKALDRCDRDRLEPGEEAERDARDTAEGEVREPRGPAGHWVHPAQLGVHEREDDDDDAGDDPAQQGGGAGGLSGEERAEEPAGADDRGFGRPGGADETHFPFQAHISGSGRRGSHGFGVTSHARSLFRSCPAGPPPACRIVALGR